MTLHFVFWSYFAEVAGMKETEIEVPEGATLDEALEVFYTHFPPFRALKNSTLVAVGVEYSLPTQLLRPQDSVSLFPPVSGG